MRKIQGQYFKIDDNMKEKKTFPGQKHYNFILWNATCMKSIFIPIKYKRYFKINALNILIPSANPILTYNGP